jgi:hypothetical protein
MSRTGRGVVEHQTATKAKNAMGNLPQGVVGALNKVREANEEVFENEAAEDKPIPPGFKNLALFGKLVEDISIGDSTIKISTLSSRQQKEIVKRLMKIEQDERILNIKPYTLAEAIVSVNGLSLNEIYSGEQHLSEYEQKVEVIMEFQASLVDKIFEHYEKMVERSMGLYNDGGIKENSKN